MIVFFCPALQVCTAYRSLYHFESKSSMMKRNPIYILSMKIGSLEMKKSEMKYWKMEAPHSKDFEVFLQAFFSELGEGYVVLYQSSQA